MSYPFATVQSELADLAAHIEQLDVTQVDRTELMRWDVAVHRAIYRAANNPHLEDVLIGYDNLATRIHCLFLDRMPRVDAHVREHVELLRASPPATPTGPTASSVSTSSASSGPSAR